MKNMNRKSERGLVRHSKRQREAGSALVYILIAIALLAALTVTFMEPSSQQTTSQSAFRSTAALQGQIDTIRSAVQECVLRYSNGDANIPNDPAEDEEGARQEYPIRPNSPYFDATPASTIAATTGQLARDIRCPGNQDGPETKDHARIFAGGSGKFLPAPPDLFEDWRWYNGPAGVFFVINTPNSDAFLRTSLEKLDDRFSECESDVITGPANLDDTTTPQLTCANGHLCFRVWMINMGTGPHADQNIDPSCGGSDL